MWIKYIRPACVCHCAPCAFYASIHAAPHTQCDNSTISPICFIVRQHIRWAFVCMWVKEPYEKKKPILQFHVYYWVYSHMYFCTRFEPSQLNGTADLVILCMCDICLSVRKITVRNMENWKREWTQYISYMLPTISHYYYVYDFVMIFMITTRQK